MAKRSILHRIRKLLRSRESSYHPSSSIYKWWVLANVMIGTFMAVLDATIVNVGLPKIMASFGVGLDEIEWVLTAYMLAMAVMLPTSGWLADRFGYKKMYFIGLFFFTFGSFLCGLATDENMLIIARIVQGLGAGAVQPIGMAIITREFPPKQRGLALGFWAISAAASVSFGPLIGGYLVDNFSWQLIFDVNVPVGIMGLFATVIIQREYVNKNIGSFDLIGFISVSIFLPTLLYALTESTAASNAEGWGAPYLLMFFGISAIALAVFLTTEFTVKSPLMDLRLLANRNFGISNIIMFIFGIGMFGSTFLLPLYLQNSLGYTALQAGAVFLPIGFLQGLTSPIAGSLADKTNFKVLIILGIILMAISFYLNSYLSYLTEHSYIMTALYIRGLGMGMLFSPLSALTLSDIPRSKMAQASGLFNITRQIGGSFGVAILATILTSRIKFHNEMYGGAIQQGSQVFSNVLRNLNGYIRADVGSSFPVAAKQAQAAIMSNVANQAYIQGINDDFLIAAIFTIICVIPVLFLHEPKHKTKHEVTEM
jgi:DHA2 family multidrug resistance protein